MRRKGRSVDEIKQATISSISMILDQILELGFDVGLTVQELNLLLRSRAVHTAAKRVVIESGRMSKSRVAILTGLPRSEVTKMLNQEDSGLRVHKRPNTAAGIIACWYENPRFLGPDGQPRVLPIYGKRASFEQLVALRGRGIPVRAMLDALLELNAVEALPNQHVRPRSRIAISTGLSPRAIIALGDKCSDLLGTLIENLRGMKPPLVEASVAGNLPDSIVPLVRRELAGQTMSFINAVDSILKKAKLKGGTKHKSFGRRHIRLGMSVHYFEKSKEGLARKEFNSRKNLRRRKRGTAKPSGGSDAS